MNSQMNAEIMQHEWWPEWDAIHVGATEFRPEPSVVTKTARRDVVGMCVLPVWCKDDLRSDRTKDLSQFPSRFKIRLQAPVRKFQITTPRESENVC